MFILKKYATSYTMDPAVGCFFRNIFLMLLFSPRVIRLALSVDRGLPCVYDLFHPDPDQKGSPDRTTVSRNLIHVRDM